MKPKPPACAPSCSRIITTRCRRSPSCSRKPSTPKLELLTGVPLNNTVGGLNPYAVEHGFKLNARLVWMPTFSAANHIRHSHRKNYLATREAMLKPKGLTIVTDTGELLDEVKVILDQIAQYDAVLSAGHSAHLGDLAAVR